MEIKKGDYIQGIENSGIPTRPRIMRGWVDSISGSNVLIKADDSFEGARGTMLDINTVSIVANRVKDWWKVDPHRIKPGSVVKHFKGNKYVLDGYARHVDYGEVAVYHKYGDTSEVWVRDAIEFNSLNDKKSDKYPSEYRFEVVEA